MSVTNQGYRPTVVVVGGGFAGTAVAKALDGSSYVVLVEPKDAFMYNVAALRAFVNPSWLSKIFFPYHKLLTHGRVVRDRAVLVDSGRVVTSSGEEITADYIVLASGSNYPFPAKTDLVDSDRTREKVLAGHQALARAKRILLVGAGPVGIELAGEIGHRWTDKSVILLDGANELLTGPYSDELRTELRHQLEALGVEIRLGSGLPTLPPTDPGELATFTVISQDGGEVTADIWFRCFGITPNSEYLGEALAPARRPDGYVEVSPSLQVTGHRNIFALGDVSTADVNIAGFALSQAEIIVNNIKALADGRSELAEYKRAGTGILIPMGPSGGAGQFPGADHIVGRDAVADIKGSHLNIDLFVEFFGLGDLVTD